MPLSKQAIERLKRICQKETGEPLNDTEAWDMAMRLVSYFEALGAADIAAARPLALTDRQTPVHDEASPSLRA